jgi:cell division septal protein FtsQ
MVMFSTLITTFVLFTFVTAWMLIFLSFPVRDKIVNIEGSSHDVSKSLTSYVQPSSSSSLSPIRRQSYGTRRPALDMDLEQLQTVEE